MTILDSKHVDQLQASGIGDAIIAQRGYCSIAPGSIHDWRKLSPVQIHSDSLLRRVLHQGALAFPLFRCGQDEPYTWILRPDQPRLNKDGKPVKYEYPARAKNIFDCLPAYRPALRDHTVDLWLTEGAKKADALATVYGSQVVPVNENGVWGWRSRESGLIDDLAQIVWEGRRVVIAPDGDVRHNQHVLQAVKRTAKLLLAHGVKELLICLLPQTKDGPKLGVDDYLAQGHSTSELEGHLVELGTVESTARVSLMKHPSTGIALYLPPGYDVQGQALLRRSQQGATQLYTGVIAVTGLGRNLHTQEETATVFWNGRGACTEVTMPRCDLADTRSCTRTLAARGAAIHPNNAKHVSTYLVEFIQENYELLPQIDYVDRMGMVQPAGQTTPGLVLPAGTIGLARPVRYQGREVRVGKNHDVYKQVLHEVAGWSSTSVFWAVFALGLAGPLLARLRPERNPVIYLSGTSSSGKTTLAQFALGAYGNPDGAPLQHQCGSGTTTKIGMQQALTMTNGVPIFFDDVHMLEQHNASRIAGLIYDFANGQLRSYGTPDQRGGGGEQLSGTLLLAGEIVPQFEHAGTLSRTLLINCRTHLPLGVAAKSAEGLKRAQAIRRGWEQDGAGLFGHELCAAIWRDWASFLQEVEAFEHDATLDGLQAWRKTFAVAAATLNVALDMLGIQKNLGDMLRGWSQMYQQGQYQRDPSDEAFDRLITMLVQSELVNGNGWQMLNYERKLVAVKRQYDRYWRVLSTSPQFKTVVGTFAIEQYGQSWLEQGLITAHPNGLVSRQAFVQTGYAQCILLPDSHFTPQEGDG